MRGSAALAVLHLGTFVASSPVSSQGIAFLYESMASAIARLLG